MSEGDHGLQPQVCGVSGSCHHSMTGTSSSEDVQVSGVLEKILTGLRQQLNTNMVHKPAWIWFSLQRRSLSSLSWVDPGALTPSSLDGVHVLVSFMEEPVLMWSSCVLRSPPVQVRSLHRDRHHPHERLSQTQGEAPSGELVLLL